MGDVVKIHRLPSRIPHTQKKSEKTQESTWQSLDSLVHLACRMVEHKEVIKDMAKVTTKEMIALIDEDIKFALEIGDKEFVGYLKDAKEKLLDAEYPTRHEEYAELFGK